MRESTVKYNASRRKFRLLWRGEKASPMEGRRPEALAAAGSEVTSRVNRESSGFHLAHCQSTKLHRGPDALSTRTSVLEGYLLRIHWNLSESALSPTRELRNGSTHQHDVMRPS